jgi:HPt (histidine-containing phosphotransfer) domain-containing protein
MMASSGALSSVGGGRAASLIDEDHLGRMTLGDRELEREVLEIFVRQIAIMLSRVAAAQPALTAAAAHTLKGSARGIGAWQVARAAEQVEHAAANSLNNQALAAAVEELKAAANETSAAIDERLGHAFADIARDH